MVERRLLDQQGAMSLDEQIPIVIEEPHLEALLNSEGPDVVQCPPSASPPLQSVIETTVDIRSNDQGHDQKSILPLEMPTGFLITEMVSADL
jgi:hypothetical protein